MGPFEYLEPKTVKEAVSLLSEHGDKAKVLAGGTDLMPLMKDKTIRPEFVINIGNIADLDYIHQESDQSIKIGALTTIRSIEKAAALQSNYGIIHQAACQLGSIAVRNVATIGGNLCNASPSAEMVPALLVMSTTARLFGPSGERTVPLEEFFTGPGSTLLKTDEILTEIQIPAPPAHTAGIYIKYSSRGGEDLALVGVAVLITINPSDGTCADAKVVLGAVAPTPVRVRRAEEFLKGKRIDKELAVKAALIAAEEACPIDDVRCTADYRIEMIKVAGRDAIIQAAESAKSAA